MSTLTQDQYEALLNSTNSDASGQASGNTTTYTGHFVGDLTGDVVGNVTGNSRTATALATPQNLNFIGNDATATVSGNVGNGNQNININLAVAHATNADTANNARHTDKCDYADHANLANYAVKTGYANSAGSAINDGAGNNIAEQFADHEARITANANKNTTQDTRLDNLASLTGTHTTQITALQNKDTAHETRLDALEDYTNVLAWASGTTYSQGNIVLYQYNFYQSLLNNNTGNVPSEEDSRYWKLLSETASGGTADCVHLDGTETIIGDKTFSGAINVPTKTAQDNSTNAASTAYVDGAVNALKTSLDTAVTTNALTVNGDATVTGKLNANLTGDVTGDVTGNVNGNVTGNLTGNVTGTASRATADASGNVIPNTYATKTELSTSLNDYVKLATNQTVPSKKNFSDITYFSGARAATVGGRIEMTPPTDLETYPYTGNIVIRPNKDSFKISTVYDSQNTEFAFYFALHAIGATNSGIISVPTGTILPFAGTTVPVGYLLCNYAAVSRTTYAKLFSVIGTTWGAGDGSTTFNLPDGRDRVLQGASSSHAVGTSIGAGLPNIIGGWSMVGRTANTTGAAYFGGSGTSREAVETIAQLQTVNQYFNLSLGNAIYGGSTTVQPPAISTNFIIKY